jgi:hypothetical protein
MQKQTHSVHHATVAACAGKRSRQSKNKPIISRSVRLSCRDLDFRNRKNKPTLFATSSPTHLATNGIESAKTNPLSRGLADAFSQARAENGNDTVSPNRGKPASGEGRGGPEIDLRRSDESRPVALYAPAGSVIFPGPLPGHSLAPQALGSGSSRTLYSCQPPGHPHQREPTGLQRRPLLKTL